MNKNPNVIVIINPSIASLNKPKAIALCTHVTLNPDIIKINVLNNG